MTARYPSPAELDAFAQKTANSPLSIKIFPSTVRVPQHKQLSRTVNGLDTTGQRYSPYSHPCSDGFQGLLAVIKASVVKSSDGRRTKHAAPQPVVAPYDNPLNTCYTAQRHVHKAYGMSLCKPHDMSTGATVSSRGPVVPNPRSLMRQVKLVPHSQALQLGGEARVSPSHQTEAAVACLDSGFIMQAPPQSSLAFSGAVLPTQSADTAKVGYLDGSHYGVWQHKQQQHQTLRHYQQGSLGTFHNAQGCRGSEGVVGQSPETALHLVCSTQLSYRPHPLSAGTNRAVQEQASSSPRLSCAGVHGDFSVGQYFGPSWDSVVATPHSECLTRPSDSGRPHLHRHQPQCHQPRRCLPTQPPYSTDQSLGHASALSSSLQSLECLISGIHPPCIKERMLGRGYEAMGLATLLEHQPNPHIQLQLPVYR